MTTENNFFELTVPKYLKITDDSELHLRSLIDELGLQKILLIIDPNVSETSKGTKIINIIGQYGGTIFNKISSNPRTCEVDEAATLIREKQPTIVIAVGGGSTIDLAKAAILVGLNGGTTNDYLGGKKGNEEWPIFIVLPTTCGTGSEASPYAVILDEETTQKRGIENYKFIPKYVFIDASFIDTLDPTLIAATGIDAMAHVLESYISKKSTILTQCSVKGLLINLPKILEKATFKNDHKAREALMNVAFSSRLLYPRTGLTTAHALSHPLGAVTDLHHGIAVAFFLSESLIDNYSFCTDKLNEALHLMGFATLNNFLIWYREFVSESKIKEKILDCLQKNNINTNFLSESAINSSNIPSNPKDVSVDSLSSLVKRSIEYWDSE